jgi:hypothetical protein
VVGTRRGQIQAFQQFSYTPTLTIQLPHFSAPHKTLLPLDKMDDMRHTASFQFHWNGRILDDTRQAVAVATDTWLGPEDGWNYSVNVAGVHKFIENPAHFDLMGVIACDAEEDPGGEEIVATLWNGKSIEVPWC